mmetsp:Transcript_20294/g.49754  ORF Transcript_20294/g.49754 Transcript_20294/m.49754 type:complete len:243 (-) Transcript_20294:443-1171(-)
MISGPLMITMCAPVSSTRALAINVLPHPGGPCNKTPFGEGTPAVLQSSGNRNGSSTSSRMSWIAFSDPPTESYPNPTVGRSIAPPKTTADEPLISPATTVSSSSSSFSAAVCPSISMWVTMNSSFLPFSSLRRRMWPRFRSPSADSRYGSRKRDLMSSSAISSPPSIASRVDRESSTGASVTDVILGAEECSSKIMSPLLDSSSPVKDMTFNLSPFRSLKFFARFSLTVQMDFLPLEILTRP